MHPAHLPSARINLVTVLRMRKQKRYSFRLLPLTPEEWERNMAIADKVLAYVFGEQDNKPQG